MQDESVGVIGAGDQAVETAGYLRGLGRSIKFFAGEDPVGKRVNGTWVHINAMPEGVPVINAIGYPEPRRKLVHLVGEQDFANCVCVHLNPSIQIGRDVTIAPGCVLTERVTIGSHVLINIGCNISHDVQIGDFVTVSPGVNLAGRCVIESGVFIGIGATFRDGITVGENAFIGAGAVVIDDVDPGTTVVGVPARSKASK